MGIPYRVAALFLSTRPPWTCCRRPVCSPSWHFSRPTVCRRKSGSY